MGRPRDRKHFPGERYLGGTVRRVRDPTFEEVETLRPIACNGPDLIDFNRAQTVLAHYPTTPPPPRRRLPRREPGHPSRGEPRLYGGRP